MKKYFIPDKTGRVSWSSYFREDAERQDWKMLIMSEGSGSYDLYRTPEGRKDSNSDHWYVLHGWGKVIDEVVEPKMEDDLFTLGE